MHVCCAVQSKVPYLLLYYLVRCSLGLQLVPDGCFEASHCCANPSLFPCRFVELDRCAAAAEAGYAVGLFKVLQADTMAKNDLLVGMPLHMTACGEGQRQSRTAEHSDACTGGRVQQCLRECGQALVDKGILYTSSTLLHEAH